MARNDTEREPTAALPSEPKGIKFEIDNFGKRDSIKIVMKNRDAKKGPKRVERQRQIAGRFPFHRAAFFKHMISKVTFWRRKY